MIVNRIYVGFRVWGASFQARLHAKLLARWLPQLCGEFAERLCLLLAGRTCISASVCRITVLFRILSHHMRRTRGYA